MLRDDVSDTPADSRETPTSSNNEIRPTPANGQRVISRMDRFGTWLAKIRGSSSDSESESVSGRLFVALDGHISGQFNGIADSIWEWRESKVKKWEGILDTDPNNEISYLGFDAQTVATGS
jgi:hypothetical protein